MSAKNIVIGQKVNKVKVELSKELRKNMTSEEKILWQQLRTNKLKGFHFRRQQIIDGFIVDFYCHSAGLIIEIDGEIHNQQVEYDKERENVLLARGLHILRFKNIEIRENIQKVLEQILSVCQESTHSPLPL